ncbi:hypothetical protein NHQ30_003559 [Ciborinia camelliae]|nr:hypothetical protein NHQ30_003559 [Ciborinia camelliae]
MKSVAIIGAGPAGLVAAKTLIHSCPGSFNVKIFEQSAHVGGLWAVESNPRGMINHEMSTNLSQFTVCFSDLAWGSMKFQPPPNLYPKAWQVNRYLVEYANRYIPVDTMVLETKVVSVEDTKTINQKQWKIITVGMKNGSETIEIFDYLIVASGFFSGRRSPPFSLTDINLKLDQPKKAPIMHSSQYRQLSDLFPGNQQLSKVKGKILIIGGSHSGAEVASLVALQISDAVHSPTSSSSNIQPLQIIHVMPHPLVSVPGVVQSGEKDTISFVPLDSQLYNLASRKDDPISFGYGFSTPEKRKRMKDVLGMIMDGTTEMIEEKETIISDKEEARSLDFGSPYVVVGDRYTEFVRSGAIRPILGRITKISTHDDKSGLLKATMIQTPESSSSFEIKDVAAVIYATGFSSSPALNFLPQSTKDSLGYNPSLSRLPLLLSRDCLTASIESPDNLAMMGFFDGNYWGILESQARILVRKWASKSDSSVSISPRSKESEEKSIKLHSFMEETRETIKADSASIPQNLLGDYPGLMEETFRELSLRRVDLDWNQKDGMVCPARYLDAGCDITQAEETMRKLQTVVKDSKYGRAFSARAAFRGLQGNWKAETEDLKTGSKKMLGMISFHPRYPTNQGYDSEYIYIPSPEGQDHANKKVVYRLREMDNVIEVWSVEENSESKTNKSRQTLEFNTAIGVEGQGNRLDVRSIVKGEPIVEESQEAIYSFWFAGVNVIKFTINLGSRSCICFTR